MPNNKQQTKRLKTDEARRKHNKVQRSAMRSAVKAVLEADTKEAAEQATALAMKRIDKAAKRNIIHDNTAARMKNRMARSTAGK